MTGHRSSPAASATACCAGEPAIDLTKPFLPEPLTPLFFTAAYATLSDRQRLRYNQLQALYFNEQIAFFETAIGRNVLPALARDPALSRLKDALRQFGAEENRHTEMFRRLNRLAAPQLYGARDFHFIRVPGVWAATLNSATRRPRLFPMFVWLMLLQEERSLYYSREIIRARGALEPHFVETHRVHLADEVDHVRWDEELLDELWRRAGRLRCRLNAGLFRWMLGEFFNAPKRAQVRVVEELAAEFPELRARLPQMRNALLNLAQDEAYQRTLYSRRIVPRTFARFDEWREFAAVSRVLRGYQPITRSRYEGND
jgi:hypothetical protein